MLVYTFTELLGLALLIAIMVVLIKREKQGKQDSQKLTARQAAVLALFGILFAVLLTIKLPDVWDRIFDGLFDGIFGGSSIS